MKARSALLRSGEGKPVAWACAAVFALLAGYYLLRPARDALGLAAGAREMPQLFYGTLAATFVVAPTFAAVAARVRPSRLVPGVYAFIALTVLAFAVALGPAPAGGLAAKAFFVWTSVINLFVLSVFWARVSDMLDREQAMRLVGYIAAAGTAGAVFGSAVAGGLAARVGLPVLLTAAAGLFAVAALACARLAQLAPGGPARGGTVGAAAVLWATRLAREPRLRALVVYMLAFTITSTFLYLEQARVVRAAGLSLTERTAYFARIDLAVNALAFAAQGGLTAVVLRRFGIRATLLVLPLVTAASAAALVAAPGLLTLAVVQVVRRTTEFAFARPSREVLFTEGPSVDRYEAKPFLDTFVYRSGDALGAGVYERIVGATGAAGALGATLAIVTAWAAACLRLGLSAPPSGGSPREASVRASAPRPPAPDSPPA